jgi:enoyl-CoA hydratase
MTYNQILAEKVERAFVITLNRPDKLNALNIELLQEVKTAVESVQNDPEVRAIILTGTGSKAFAAGADIAEFANFDVDQGTRMSSDGHQVMNSLEQSTKPVIAAVNGFALGGGCELAMACHFRIASENAKFGQPEVNLGLPPGYGATQRLAQIVGKGIALEMLLTAKTIDAQEAYRIGLVNAVVVQEELLNTCLKMVSKMAGKSPQAMAKVIKCVDDLYKDDINGYDSEIQDFGNAFATSDFKEGTVAFLSKQKPNFD